MVGTTPSEALPNEPIFVQLLKISQQVDHSIFRDYDRKVNADYAQLLANLLQTRRALRESLPESVLGRNHLLRDTDPFIFVLPDGDYDFILGALSALSVGGAFVPLPTKILLVEAVHLVRKCRAAAILASPAHLALAVRVQQSVSAQGHDVAVIQICSLTSPPATASASPLKISRELVIPAESPGMLLFTSGSSGPPKGVVHKRSIFYNVHVFSDPSELVLTHRNYVWIGATMPLITHTLAGATQEVIRPDPKLIWERLRKGDVTKLTGSPPLWNRLMHYFQQHLQILPDTERESYVQGACSLSIAHSGGAMPHLSLLTFWRDLGRPLRIGYSATELGGLGVRHHPDTDATVERIIGRPHPSLTIRLSEGDHGEMLIKGPTVFLKYLDDETATQAAFTEDGFYRSGDIAHRHGEDYVLDGRASADFFKSGPFRVSVLEVELVLQALPFIQEAYILSVPYPNYGSLVAALVRFKRQEVGSADTFTPSLRFLRASLATELSAYKLPTLLRVLQEDEELPRTASNKVSKPEAVKKYFQFTDNRGFAIAVEMWQFDEIDPVAQAMSMNCGAPPITLDYTLYDLYALDNDGGPQPTLIFDAWPLESYRMSSSVKFVYHFKLQEDTDAKTSLLAKNHVQRRGFVAGNMSLIVLEAGPSDGNQRPEELDTHQADIQRHFSQLSSDQQPIVDVVTRLDNAPLNSTTLVAVVLPTDPILHLSHLIEPEVHYEILSKRGLTCSGLCTPPSSVVDLLLPLEQLDNPASLQQEIDRMMLSLDTYRVPFIVKLQQTVSGLGNLVVHCDDDRKTVRKMLRTQLLAMLRQINAANYHLHPCSLILQNYIQGTDVALSLFVTRRGRPIFVCCCHQRFDQQGHWNGGTISYAAQQALDQKYAKTIELVALFLHKKGYYGPAGVDIITDHIGTHHVVDLNPRITGTYHLGLLAGHFMKRGLETAAVLSAYFPSSRITFEKVFAQEIQDGSLIITVWTHHCSLRLSCAAITVGGRDTLEMERLEAKVWAFASCTQNAAD
ncbi:hypothetical protein MY10362_009093 [Beauveria mimosiformis]